MLVLLMCNAVKGADGTVKFCFEWALSAGCLCVVPEEEINHKHNS